MIRKKRKPGRPRLKETDRKTEPVGVRLTKQLREKLDDLRARSGARTLSQAIEMCLWSALTADKKIEARFGGPTTAAFLSIVADGISAIQTYADGEHWLDNPFVYEQVRTMLDEMLGRLKPRGRRVLPENIRRLHPLLKADADKIGQKTALERMGLLDAAGNVREEKPTEFPPSIDYFDKPLARRLRGSPLAELQRHRLNARRKMEKNLGTNLEARRRNVDAQVERSSTVNLLIAYLRLKLIAGTRISIAKAFKGVTGANLGQQKQVIIKQIKAATKGKLTDPATNLDDDLDRLLDAAAKRETSAEVISDIRHRAMQRHAEQAIEKTELAHKGD